MSLLDKIISILDDAMDKWWHVEPETTPVPGAYRSIKKEDRDPADKESLNLYLGKIIDDGNVKCEVIAYLKEAFLIKILKINWDRLGTYMDIGQTYPLLLCSEFKDFKVWEVDPDKMKRTTSQVLLAWEKGSGWYWDLDS